MNDPRKPETPAGSGKHEIRPVHGAEEKPIGAASPTDASSTEDAGAQTKLSPEEQMARYEEYLKENDWGHQPC